MTPRSDGPGWAFVGTGFALCVVIALCLGYAAWHTLLHSETNERGLRRLAAHFGVDYDRLLADAPSDPATDTGPIPAVSGSRVPPPVWCPPAAALPLDPGEVPSPADDADLVVASVIHVGPPAEAGIAITADGVEYEPGPFTPLGVGDPREAARRRRTAVWVEAELERIRAAGQASGGDHRRHGRDA